MVLLLIVKKVYLKISCAPAPIKLISWCVLCVFVCFSFIQESRQGLVPTVRKSRLCQHRHLVSDFDIAALLDGGHQDFFFLAQGCLLSRCRDGLIACLDICFEAEFTCDLSVSYQHRACFYLQDEG